MKIATKYVTIFLLSLICGSLSKPTTENDLLTTGRGIGSTIWGWLTYPFTWWSSETEPLPINEQLIGSTTTHAPIDSIEIAKHNVTVWCNDQTCTTMKCDQFGCRNTTCNIYDTDLMGECREYNIASTPEEQPVKPTQPLPKPVEFPKPVELPKPVEIAKPVDLPQPVTEKLPESSSKLPNTTATPVTTIKDPSSVEEHPLELEAVLSSTVNTGPSKLILNPDQKV